MSSILSFGQLGIIHQEMYALRADYYLIIFGVTTGLLLLVSFASLFVMYDSRRNAEGQRESVSRMAAIKHKAFSRELALEMVDVLHHYMNSSKTNKQAYPGLNTLLQIMLGLVMLAWLSVLFLLDSRMEFYLYGVLCILAAVMLLAFVCKLNQFHKVGNRSLLPMDELLDANHHCDVDAVQLAAVLSRVQFRRNPNHEDEIKMYLGFPQFRGETGIVHRFSQLKLIEPAIYVRNGQQEIGGCLGSSTLLNEQSTLIPGSSYDWYEVKCKEPIDLHPLTSAIEVVLFLTSEQEKQQGNVTGIWVTYTLQVNNVQSLTEVNLNPSDVREGIASEKVRRQVENPSLWSSRN